MTSSDEPAQGRDVEIGENDAGARQLLAPGTTYLRRLQIQEELAWRSADPSLVSLVALLRMRHEEARLRAEAEKMTADALTKRGTALTAVATVMTIVGWATLGAISWASGGVPSNLWELAIATTGAVLLVGGAGSLSYRVAARHHALVARETSEMEAARRLDIAIRLVLCSEKRDERVVAAFRRYGAKLLSQSSSSTPGVEDVSAAPELLQTVKELVLGVGKLIKR